MSNSVVAQTTIDGLSIDEISNLQQLGDYTYIQSKQRLNTIGNILKQTLGDNYKLVLILLAVDIFLLVFMLTLF